MADRALIDLLRTQIREAEDGRAGEAADAADAADAPGRSPRAGSPAAPAGAGSRRGKALEGPEGAFSKIVALVNVSDRSERTIRERLAKADFAPGDIEEAVGRAKSYGFIDDGRFAQTLIRSRLAQGKGVKGIERELKGHGIELDDVAGWPDDFGFDEDGELDRALAFLDRKPPRSKNLRDGAYRKLVNRGFSSTVASSAARTWSAAHPAPR